MVPVCTPIHGFELVNFSNAPMNALNVTFLADGEENDRPLVVSQIVDNNNKKNKV